MHVVVAYSFLNQDVAAGVSNCFTGLLQSVEQQINEVAHMAKAEKAAKESRQKDAKRVLNKQRRWGFIKIEVLMDGGGISKDSES
ncbi:hypothetical protein Tco_1133956 [Tanacetum coccineum]